MAQEVCQTNVNLALKLSVIHICLVKGCSGAWDLQVIDFKTPLITDHYFHAALIQLCYWILNTRQNIFHWVHMYTSLGFWVQSPNWTWANPLFYPTLFSMALPKVSLWFFFSWRTSHGESWLYTCLTVISSRTSEVSYSYISSSPCLTWYWHVHTG